MAWYALYKWYKDWSRTGYPNMSSWYSEKLNPPKWTILKFKKSKKKNSNRRLESRRSNNRYKQTCLLELENFLF